MAKLPVQEAADLLGVRAVQVWRRIRAGELRAEQDPASGVWLVEVEPDEIDTGQGRGEDQVSIEAVAGLATELEREVLILREELRAYEREAEQVESLRAVLQRTLVHLRDVSAAPAPATDPLPETTQEAEIETEILSAEPGESDAGEPGNLAPDDAPALRHGGNGGNGGSLVRHEGNGGAPLAGGARAETRQQVDEGIELNYVEWGEDGKPVVVLLHGLTGNARNFEALAQELSNEFHCFAPDLRGHGDSAWSTEGDYRLSTLARDLDTFLQSHGLRRVALVGTALGADVALAFAGARPDWISHLVLNDSAPDLSDAGLDRIRRHLAESPEEFESLDAAVDWWRATFPILTDYSEASIRRFVGHSVRAAADGTMRWKFDPRFRELSPQSIRDVDLMVSAGRVTCPTLVLRGAESDVVSEFLAKQLVEGLTRSGGGDGAQLVSIEGVGHAPSLAEPEALDALENFLSAVPAI